jgi:hypothetical protein
MRNRPKAAVLAVYPGAVCWRCIDDWRVMWRKSETQRAPKMIGRGDTAFAAWHNAQENTKGTGK